MPRQLTPAVRRFSRNILISAALATALVAVCGLAENSASVEKLQTAYDKIHITYLEQGRGPAVVLIPSLGRGAEDFDDLAGRLAQAGFRVLRVQPRGVDASTGPMTGLTLRDLANDVAHVITASGETRAVVLGHDDGNRVARAVAAYFPQRFRRSSW